VAVLAGPFSLAGRSAIVTGGGTGIGAETARIIVRHGIDGVVLDACTEADLQRVRAEPEDLGRDGQPRAPGARGAHRRGARGVRRRHGRGGDGAVRPDRRTGRQRRRYAVVSPENTPATAWDSVFGLDATGPFLCAREVVRHMIAAGRGVIVNLSSGPPA
jgi:NAD(P)-dependent dehydrogenase (short-subunit alcohol dehydrogenase family)